VRWVHAHQDRADERFHILYVPRAVQTIRELLRRIVAGLPGGGGAEFIQRVDEAVGSATPAELADRLLAEMRHVLTWTLEPRPAPEGRETLVERGQREDRNRLLGEADEADGKRRNGLADLVELEPVNRRLLRPDGLLRELAQAVNERTSRRDVPGFGRDDLPLREAGMLRALRGNRDLHELWNGVTVEPELALGLLDD